MHRLLPLFLATVLLAVPGLTADQWVKGCTHAHTTHSDGDASPEAAAAWYKAHGYGFLFITDHGTRTDPAECAAVVDDSFIVIGGEEVNTNVGPRPVHANGLGLSQTVPSGTGTTAVEVLRSHIANITGAGGIVQVNHPNWRQGLDYGDLLQVDGYHLLEIHNLGCDDAGDYARPSTEQLWDILLSAGKTVYGVATDDTHHYAPDSKATDSIPGQGWVVARVPRLTAEAVLRALKTGDFYSSNGVELADVTYGRRHLRVTVRPAAGETYRILFIGQHGQILREEAATRATYRLSGQPGEAYVRAKVISGKGKVAWTQPVWWGR